jgi:hypothetical protein
MYFLRPIKKSAEVNSISIYVSGFITAVAVFLNPSAIPPCFSVDIALNFLLSWLLVLLNSMYGTKLFLKEEKNYEGCTCTYVIFFLADQFFFCNKSTVHEIIVFPVISLVLINLFSLLI